MSVGKAFAAHNTVRHCDREYARGAVHTNSVEGFNDRIRCTVAGVFHHISPHLANLYLNEIGFRWSQRVITGQVVRRTRKGRDAVKPRWTRISPALQHAYGGLFERDVEANNLSHGSLRSKSGRARA